jgi:hypothetical protein
VRSTLHVRTVGIVFKAGVWLARNVLDACKRQRFGTAHDVAASAGATAPAHWICGESVRGSYGGFNVYMYSDVNREAISRRPLSYPLINHLGTLRHHSPYSNPRSQTPAHKS